MHPSLQGSTIDNIQDRASTKMFINREMKRNGSLVHRIHSAISRKKKMPQAAAWMDREIYYTECSQLEKEREINISLTGGIYKFIKMN